MSSINKKGLSEIIAVVMMIGMSVVALTLLGTFLFNLVGETAQLAPAVSCLEMTSKMESACYDGPNLELQIKLKRGLGDKGITSFKFGVESAGTTNSYSCGEECGCIIPEMGETKILSYGFSTMPDKLTLFANENCNLGTKKVIACQS